MSKQSFPCDGRHVDSFLWRMSTSAVGDCSQISEDHIVRVSGVRYLPSWFCRDFLIYVDNKLNRKMEI